MYMKNLKPCVFTISGPSGSGKTTVKSLITSLDYGFVDIPKYSTRQMRNNETDIVSVGEIPDFCDIKYESYGERYGFCSDDIINVLDGCKTPIIVINDLGGIEELRKYISVISLYIYRNPPSEQKFIAQEIARNTNGHLTEEQIFLTAHKRFRKADSITRMWIENQKSFDMTIWNTDIFQGTVNQVQNYLNAFFRGVLPERERKRNNTSKLILIAGGGDKSGIGQMSGKDALIDSIQKVYDLNASVIPKMTTRVQREDDGDEIICQTLIDGTPNPNFDMTQCDLIYQRCRKQNNILYGINTNRIRQGLENGKHQFLSVTDEHAIQTLIEMFGIARVERIFVQTFLENEMKGSDYYSALELFSSRPEIFNNSFLYDGSNPEGRELLLNQLSRFLRTNNLENTILIKKFERFNQKQEYKVASSF